MPTRRSFLVTTALAATAALGDISTADARGVDPAPGRLEVEGYLQCWSSDSLAIARREASALTRIGISGATLIDGGGRLEDPPGFADDVSDIAHAAGARSEFLFTNYSPDGFSRALLDGLLDSPTNRERVIGQLLSWITTLDLDGIQIDLENLEARHGAPLVTFVRELREALPDEKGLTMAVTASSSAAQYRSRGYLFADLNPHIGRYVLMTYAQSGPWSGPGALGGIAYTRRSVDAALSAGIPVAKLAMGIGAQGYAWRPDGTVEKISPATAREMAGSRARFDEIEREATAELPDGTLVWWSDARAVRERLELAQSLGLPGVAIWSLNTADPLA